jgi:ATP-binding cassette subfamily C protein
MTIAKSDPANTWSEYKHLLMIVAAFSACINLLMLTGPLYMLQIYDRVLGSRSEATLVALSAIVTLLFVAMGMLDAARARVLSRIGARMQDGLDRRAFSAAIRRLSRAQRRTSAEARRAWSVARPTSRPQRAASA